MNEKCMKLSSSTPLMVNGKTLIKQQSIRSQSRIHITTFEKGVKFEVPGKDLSFIQEILGRTTDNTNWAVNVERKGRKVTILYFEKDERSGNEDRTSPKPKDITLTLPYIKETHNKLKKQALKKTVSKAFINKLTKAPVDLYKLTISSLQLSNGIEVLRTTKMFKYFIGPGNNEALVNKVLSNKKGWVKVYNMQAANFIWTQVKKKEVFELIPVKSSEDEEKNVNEVTTSLGIFQGCAFAEMHPLSLLDPTKTKVYNRLEYNRELSSKKRLFYNLKRYYVSRNMDPFQYIPLTFHIIKGSRDPNFLAFKERFLEIEAEIASSNDSCLTNIWLIKPGELTNRGNGISVCSSFNEIVSRINDYDGAKPKRTFIIQKYIYRPLLYKMRKFDIRCYALITSYNSNLQAFFYQDGYLRTSVAEFSLENIRNKFIHLTNDAVQKKSQDYGKYEDGNKLSYQEFQEYLNLTSFEPVNFFETVLPKIRGLVKDSVISTFAKLDVKERLHSFEVLGYDFMVDEFYHPWLIEVNTNPCLALSGPYLAELIPKMLKDAMQIALDQVFPIECAEFEENRFVMIFNKATYNPNV